MNGVRDFSELLLMLAPHAAHRVALNGIGVWQAGQVMCAEPLRGLFR